MKSCALHCEADRLREIYVEILYGAEAAFICYQAAAVRAYILGNFILALNGRMLFSTMACAALRHVRE